MRSIRCKLMTISPDFCFSHEKCKHCEFAVNINTASLPLAAAASLTLCLRTSVPHDGFIESTYFYCLLYALRKMENSLQWILIANDDNDDNDDGNDVAINSVCFN